MFLQFIRSGFLLLVLVEFSASLAPYEEIFDEDCPANDACVRFCCKNDSLCSQPNYFNLSLLPQAAKLGSSYKIIKRDLDCGPYVEDQYEWEFLSVRISIAETLVFNHEHFCRTDLFGNTSMQMISLIPSITSTVLKTTELISCLFAKKSQLKVVQLPKQIL